VTVSVLQLDAPAKVNLSLGVTGRRPDGYHLLATRMVLLELADRLLLMPGGSGLRVEAPPDEPVPTAPGENLAWRGLLAGVGGPVPMAMLALEKHVPAAAGLGGGSSDAAAAWRLGRRWVQEPDTVDEEQLRDLARLGADIPFFASQQPAAMVTGIGEQVAAMELPQDGDLVVLVHPGFSLPTAAVFAELRPDDWSGGAVPDGHNDLEPAARRLRPELEDVFRLVAAAGGRPQLSGSGPTIFIRTDDAERAASVAGRVEGAGLQVRSTRLRREPATIATFTDAEEG
jgi:4-diphosphocytidyl-2-C-methyl-D-erythritol kinase